MRLTLRWLAGRYGVYRLAPDAALPSWAGDGAFTTVSRSADELSVLCAWREQQALPAIGPLLCCALCGPVDFACTGILARLVTPLADADISVFSVATYDTDYLLVNEPDGERARQALEAAGARFLAPA